MARRATRQLEKAAPRATAASIARVKPTKAATKTSSRSAKEASVATATTRPNLDGLTADQKVAVLLRDREKLLLRLDAAEQRVRALETRDAHLADRISWALDTLNDLLRLPDTSS